MKKLLVIAILGFATIAFCQKDVPIETSSLRPANSRAIFNRDTSNISLIQITLRNDSAGATDQVKFSEINIYGDTVTLRFKDLKTGTEDTIVSKTGLSRNYEILQPIVGKLLVKLLSATSIDLYIRKRKIY